MIKSFQMISDASHGWLKVPRVELERLGIQGNISGYSYVKGDFVFLEEDSDAGVFIDARKAEGNVIKVKEIVRESCRKIRNYSAFTHCPVAETLAETVAEVIAVIDVEVKPAKQLSQTPSAIRKREARAKAKALQSA